MAFEVTDELVEAAYEIVDGWVSGRPNRLGRRLGPLGAADEGFGPGHGP